MRRSSGESHTCPRRGCIRRVPNQIYCCPEDWAVLSDDARNAIYSTARLNSLHPDRRAAFEKTQEEWNDLQKGQPE